MADELADLMAEADEEEAMKELAKMDDVMVPGGSIAAKPQANPVVAAQAAEANEEDELA